MSAAPEAQPAAGGRAGGRGRETGGWQKMMGLARGGGAESAEGQARAVTGRPAVLRAARPSYRQIWMADGVSAAGPDMLAAAAAAGS